MHSRRLLFSFLVVACLAYQFLQIVSNSRYADRKLNAKLPVPHVGQCGHMPQLTMKLAEDRVGNALRPIQLQLANNKTMTVEGMSEEYLRRVFRGQRIAFLGDSTLYYLSKYMYILMHQSDDKAMFVPGNIANLTAANEAVDGQVARLCKQHKRNATSNRHCLNIKKWETPAIPIEDKINNEYFLQWVGMHATRDNWRTEEIVDGMWKAVAEEIQPDVMVVNLGFHWLHFYNLIRDTGPEAIMRWVNYETWLQQVLDKARNDPKIKVLLFKTNNFACDEKMTRRYGKAVELFNALDAETLQKCENSVRAAFSEPNVHGNITDTQISDYCVNGTLSHRGATQLNQRLRKFMDKLEPQSGMYVGLFNDHDVQHCDFTPGGDALHFHDLNLLRIRMLANHLECATATEQQAASWRNSNAEELR